MTFRTALAAAAITLGLAALTLLSGFEHSASLEVIRSLRSDYRELSRVDGDEASAAALSSTDAMTDMLAKEVANLEKARRWMEGDDGDDGEKKSPGREDGRGAKDNSYDRYKEEEYRDMLARERAKGDGKEEEAHSDLLDRESTLRPASPAVREVRNSAGYGSNDFRKVLHMVAPGPEPPHLRPILEYTAHRAARQGWAAKVWKGTDVDELLRREYDPSLRSLGRDLRRVWTAITRTEDASERVRRMGGFMKLLIVYTRGGAFLNQGLVPCEGLDEMVGGTVRGPVGTTASFPFGTDGAAAAFAAPAKHPALSAALELLVQAKEGDAAYLDAAEALRRTVRAYSMSRIEGVNPPGGWREIGKVRIGSYRADGPRNPSDEGMKLWNLELHAEAEEGGFGNKCVEETDMIPFFLEEGCRANVRVKFNECGRTVA